MKQSFWVKTVSSDSTMFQHDVPLIVSVSVSVSLGLGRACVRACVREHAGWHACPLEHTCLRAS